MGVREKKLCCENDGRVIASFDFSNNDQNISEIEQRQSSFTDGFQENIGDEYIEEIEMLKDFDDSHEKPLAANLNKKKTISDNFKEYIKLCRELDLIQSWVDFEKYCRLKDG